MTETEGYKVVRLAGEHHVSSCFAPLQGALFYTIGVKTPRKEGHGPLAVFDTIDNARAFISDNRRSPGLNAHLRLYKCRYEPLELERISRWSALWCPDAYQFDAINPSCSESMALDDLPRGTVLAKSVELIELIE